MSTVTRRQVLAGLGALVATPALASPSKREVDMNLVLALDISASVSPARWEVQKQGYAAAFRNTAVHEAILSGPMQAIGMTAMLWSGSREQWQIMPWTLVDNREKIGELAALFSGMARPPTAFTSIGGAMNFAARLVNQSPFQAPRSVVDISGDGVDNDTYVRGDGPVSFSKIRGEVLAQNPLLTFNGLALLGAPDVKVDLFQYFCDEVIGGPGAFALAVEDSSRLDLFTRGIEQKLIMEIS